MRKFRFKRMLSKYRQNQLSPEKKKQVDAWLDGLSTQEQEDAIQWDATRQQATLQKIKEQINNPTGNHTMVHPKANRQFWMMAVAAAFTACVVIAWFAIPKIFTPVIDVTTFTQPGLKKTILTDGTLVWLEGDSRLTYEESADGTQRLATLVGEALFEVAKDPNRPFIIACGEISVRVLGTSFSLRSDTTGVALKVLTGKVQVVTPHNAVGMEVLPNEQMVYDRTGAAKKSILTQDDMRTITGLDAYAMNFNKVSMKDVIKRIEQKFEVTIQVSEQQLFKCNITADFTDKSLDTTLTMLTEMLDIEYAIQAQTVNITGKGC